MAKDYCTPEGLCDYHKTNAGGPCGPSKASVPDPPDMVNNPSHYGGADNPYEHVKVAKAWGLLSNAFLYNATKYICRVGKKGRGKALEDLRKAAWYLQKEIERLETE